MVEIIYSTEGAMVNWANRILCPSICCHPAWPMSIYPGSPASRSTWAAPVGSSRNDPAPEQQRHGRRLGWGGQFGRRALRGDVESSAVVESPHSLAGSLTSLTRRARSSAGPGATLDRGQLQLRQARQGNVPGKMCHARSDSQVPSYLALLAGTVVPVLLGAGLEHPETGRGVNHVPVLLAPRCRLDQWG